MKMYRDHNGLMYGLPYIEVVRKLHRDYLEIVED